MSEQTPDLTPTAPTSEVSAQVGAPPAGHETAHGTEAAHEGGGGLPQFELQHWAGQIGYLLILFAITYLLIAKVFAPRLRRVFDEREQTISGAVAAARQVQAEAADQAQAAKREVDEARAQSRAMAAAAKTRVTEQANARAATEEAAVAGRIAEAEAAIAKTRDAAMANVGAIAADTAAALVERLTGTSASAAEVKAAAAGGAA